MSRSQSLNRPTTDYELFRRAIVIRDQSAWDEVYLLYHPWLQAVIRSRRINEINSDRTLVEEFAHEALRRFWQSFTADKFMRSNGLASIIKYLESCAISAINTWFRRPESRWEPLERDDGDDESEREGTLPDPNSPDPLEATLAGEYERHRQQIWKCLVDHCTNDLERLVIRRWAVEAKSFTEIFEENMELWGGKISRVYQSWRNYCERKFDPLCQALLENWLE